MRDDPVLRWLVESRNYIEKQGDLNTASTMRVSLTNSYLSGDPFEVVVPPQLRSGEIAHYLATSKHRPSMLWPDSTLRVERRWVDSNLPDQEILSAIAHALGVYVELLADGHGKLIPNPYEGLEARALEQLDASLEKRATDIALDTNDVVELLRRPIKKNAILGRFARERYGTYDVRADDLDSLDKFAYQVMETAKRIISVDKWHAMYVWLFREGHLVTMVTNLPKDRREKYLFWRDVAAEVKRYKCDGVVSAGEAWLSRMPAGHTMQFPADDPARREIILVTAEAATGKCLTLTTEFSRGQKGEIIFAQTQSEDQFIEGGFMEPVRAVWRGTRRI